jgi:hypothetical protein
MKRDNMNTPNKKYTINSNIGRINLLEIIKVAKRNNKQ